MGVWDFRQLQQNLDKKAPPPLVFVFGDEDYLIGESLALIKAKVVSEDSADFNYDQFFCGDVEMAKVVDTLETLPMMASQRLVLLRGVEKLKDKDWQTLNQVIENPVDSTCFALVAYKVDKRKKYYKSLQKKGQLIELKRPYENQVPPWIDYMAAQNKLQMGQEQRTLVQQLVGSNLSELNSELKKLKQYMGDRNKVENDDLMQVISQVKVDSIFDLTDAIGRKDRVQALTMLANLLDHGQSEVGTMALVLRHMRILAKLKEGLKEGLRGAQLCSKVGVPSFFLQKYQGQAHQWKDKQIAHTIDALFETDKALKSSPVSSHIWLENFILKTCQ